MQVFRTLIALDRKNILTEPENVSFALKYYLIILVFSGV
jgi:hypothetical protein